MTFEVEVAGRVRHVTVEPLGANDGSGGRFRVLVDTAAHVVDARPTDLGWSIVYDVESRSVDVALTEQVRGQILVQFPQVDVAVTIDGRRFRGEPQKTGPSTEEARITAPMPGRVVRVLVTPGDEVAVRQALVVVEAMKMENELVASRAGRVAEVLVTEGQSVEAGRLLVRLDEEQTS